MSRKIVTGEYQPHLEAALIEEVRRLRERDCLSPILIVVPTNFLSLHLSRLLAARLGGHAELHFLTLLDLARRLAEQPLALEGKSAIPPMADLLLLRQAVRSCLGKLDSPYFGRVSETDGFLKVFLEAVGDLKEGCLTPDDLTAVVDEVKLRPVAVDKIREVAALWAAYESGKSSAGFYDRADLFSVAASNATRDRWLSGMRQLLIYGFYDLNPLQKRLIKKCVSVLETVVFFPYRDEPAFEYASPMLHWLKSLGLQAADELPADGGIDISSDEPGGVGRVQAEGLQCGEAPETTGRGASPRGLLLLKTQLFASSAREADESDRYSQSSGSEADSTDGTSILSAPGEIRESKEICRRLFLLAGARGVLSEAGEDPKQVSANQLRLNEIGILMREPARYVNHLARAFDATGVEPFIIEGLPLVRSRAAISLVLLMELIESDFARRPVMDFLTFAEIDLDAFLKSGSGSKNGLRASSSSADALVSPIQGANPALWDLLSKEAGIVKGLDTWGKKLADLRSRRRPPPDAGESFEREGEQAQRDRERALDTLSRFMAKLAAWMRFFPTEDTPAKLAERTTALYGALIAPCPNRDRVIEAIKDLALLGSCVASIQRFSFFWLVRKQLEQVQSSMGRFQGEGPVVAGLMSARGLPFKVVVLPGLTEGGFPKAARQDPVLLDGERTALNKALVDMGVEGELGLKSERLKEEKLLFRLSVGAASSHVLFTYPRIDPFTGTERMPSGFLLDAARAVTGSACDSASIDELPFSERVPLARLFPNNHVFLDQSEFDLSLADAAAGRDDTVALEHLRRGETFFKNVLEAEGFRWGEPVFTRYDGVIEAPEAISALKGRYVGRSGVAGPTSLQRYAACPFVYLMRYIFEIEAVEDPEALLSMPPIDRGGLAHEILEKAYREIFSGGNKERPNWEVVLRAVAKEVLSAYRSKSDFGLPLLWELEEEQLVEDLVYSVGRDLEELAGFAPLELETAYGLKYKDKSKGPLRFPLEPDRDIPLGGVMDRVDADRETRRCKVVDYKTGRGAGYKNDSFQGGTTLQLPLYVLGARHLFHNELDVEGAEYLFVSGPRRGSRVRFTAQVVDNRLGDLKTILGTIVRGVETGLFFASPGGSCDCCDYSMACGSCRRLFERKRTDPKAEAFLEMREIE